MFGEDLVERERFNIEGERIVEKREATTAGEVSLNSQEE